MVFKCVSTAPCKSGGTCIVTADCSCHNNWHRDRHRCHWVSKGPDLLNVLQGLDRSAQWRPLTPNASTEMARTCPSRTYEVPSAKSRLTFLTHCFLGHHFWVGFCPLNSFHHFDPDPIHTKYSVERKPESKQGPPVYLLGTLAEWASKPQPRGKVPRKDDAQLLASSPSQPRPEHSCVLRLFAFQSRFFCRSDNSLITQ